MSSFVKARIFDHVLRREDGHLANRFAYAISAFVAGEVPLEPTQRLRRRMGTGSSSAIVRLRFADDHDGRATVTVLAPDERFGNPSDAEVVAHVLSAVDRANARFEVSYRVVAVQYQSDNDVKCHLIGRAAYLVVARLVDVGVDNFVGAA